MKHIAIYKQQSGTFDTILPRWLQSLLVSSNRYSYSATIFLSAAMTE